MSDARAATYGEPLPLRPGDRGPAVADLQQRLIRLGLGTGEDEAGFFGPSTTVAVRAFQLQRGLEVDGRCGHGTWSAVVEAGFRLGDRLLYQRSPMLVGDDVAELQERLSMLGFDPGGIDGRFGMRTSDALAEFQRNVGLPADAICGLRSLEELRRVEPVGGGRELVSTIGEHLRVATTAATLAGCSVAVGEEGGFAIGTAAICRSLANSGARPLELHHPDQSVQAALSNAAAVQCYIGLRLEPANEGVSALYYRGFRYESAESLRLAELLAPSVAAALGLPAGGVRGMAAPILRETQMPAVVLELGPPAEVAMRTPALAVAVTEAIREWLALHRE